MKRHGYIIGGQVQGVGFRPFVYRAATRLRLTGHVGNTSDGVRVEVQGTDEALAAFAHALEHELPPLARITSLRREELPLADGEAAFAIAHSEGHHGGRGNGGRGDRCIRRRSPGTVGSSSWTWWPGRRGWNG